MSDVNRPAPPHGVRGQLNSRFEQHTIGHLRRSPLRHWPAPSRAPSQPCPTVPWQVRHVLGGFRQEKMQ